MLRHRIITAALLLLAPVAALAASERDNARCLSCHGSASTAQSDRGSHLFIDPLQFSSTTHAQIGCAACHGSVSAAHPKDGVRPTRATCQECHGGVQTEYSGTAHAKNAACADCHDPHRAKGVIYASGSDMNRQCSKCHDIPKMTAKHGKWLPQSDLHMEAIPCITCHTGSKEYLINLYLQIPDKKGELQTAGYKELAALSSTGSLKQLVDKNADGIISLDEVRQLNKFAKSKGMVLNGMMMPKNMSHTFQTLDNRWDCTFCHAAGPKSNQESYLALPEKNGQFARLQVQRGAVLDLLYGTPDFYMLGSTRSFPLSVVGGLIILGGLFMPIGHGTFRFLTRKNRKEH